MRSRRASGAWKEKARWLTGAVATDMAELGKTENSVAFADAVLGELGCGQPAFDNSKAQNH